MARSGVARRKAWTMGQDAIDCRFVLSATWGSRGSVRFPDLVYDNVLVHWVLALRRRAFVKDVAQ